MANRPSWRRWPRVFRRNPSSEVDDELRYHVDERVRDYIARGMDPEAAKRAALERLGDLERARSECAGLLAAERRAKARRVMMSISWLDVKLGLRMLAKYPGLSLVAVLGMSLAIAIGAASFAVVFEILDPTLPLDEGDRVVAIQNNHADTPADADRHVLHDFLVWRDELTSVQDVGAFRDDHRNLIAPGGSTELVRVAEMSASGFRVARVPPLLGRPIVDADEREGASPVIVMAYEEWQRRFDGDPEIIGRQVRLGSTLHTVVGVMPEGFRFPRFHKYWTPLRLNPSDYERGGGPAIEVFGRLADGVTLDHAQAELTTLARRIAVAYSETHEQLRTRIMPFMHPYMDLDDPRMQWVLHVYQLLVSTLLVLVAVNVAVLVYARTATRSGEIAVRSALGASRRRITAQLFVEALLLSSVAAAIGLTIASAALVWFQRFIEVVFEGEPPFFLDFGLSASVVAYGVALAVLGGAIVGVLPALEATGRRVQAGLQQLSSRGSQMQLGRTWTALIVGQVAIAVAVLPSAIHYTNELIRFADYDPGYAPQDFLGAQLVLARAESPPTAEADAYQRAYESRFANRSAALIRRLEAEPGVAVTFSSAGLGGESLRIEVDAAEPRSGVGAPGAAGPEGHAVLINQVDTDFFDVFGVPLLAGRGFDDADTREGSTSVIVNRTFAERVLGGDNVLGRLVRPVSRDDSDAGAVEDRWFEIVGVVPDFPNSRPFDDVDPRLYQPVAPGDIQSVRLSLRIRDGSMARLAARLRDITAVVDPELQLHGLRSHVELDRQLQRFTRAVPVAIMAATLSVVLLSAAGIYAMLSFTIARRRREIGIRSALGADARRILRAIFARSSAQLGMGVAAGLIIATAAEWVTGGSVMGGRASFVLPAVAALMLAVGLLAALGPARRGLAVEPTEALREE